MVPVGCLREAEGDSIVAALRRYEAIRKLRASKVQRLSRTRGEPWPRGDGYHLPDGEEQRQRGKEGRRGRNRRAVPRRARHHTNGGQAPRRKREKTGTRSELPRLRRSARVPDRRRGRLLLQYRNVTNGRPRSFPPRLQRLAMTLADVTLHFGMSCSAVAISFTGGSFE